jgi:uncharacterized protein YbbC (DUF1343 family)
MKNVAILFLSLCICLFTKANSQNEFFSVSYDTTIITASERTSIYINSLKNKRVGVVANQTSVIGKTHLIDTLLSMGVNIKKVFSPEHGFRGKASAGEIVKSSKDLETGLPIVSLYGKNKKPTPEQIKDLDVIVFDIQDVGARFYTYISTLHYIMEAAAENGIKVLILDRPNPNGFYVDGPVLNSKFKSFVGIHKIPVVHGLTVGELANMINGEGWLKNGIKCEIEIVKSINYEHSDFYQLPVAPSPNLPNMASVYLYPSICFFEGTSVSVGRGTNLPFQIIGSPFIDSTEFSFIPTPNEGSKNPKHEGKKCNGYNLSMFGLLYIRNTKELYLHWLVGMNMKTIGKFIIRPDFFDLLAGTDSLRIQIEAGKTTEEIRASWQIDLDAYKVLRKKYLLYPDFE